MWRYTYNLAGLFETPALPAASVDVSPDRLDVEKRITAARRRQKNVLSQHDCRAILKNYGIGIWPLPRISAQSLHVYLRIGSFVDPLFGPVLYFASAMGPEGIAGDVALGLPPLNSNLAVRMMEQTDVYSIIKKWAK